jgi:hypothetical protein
MDNTVLEDDTLYGVLGGSVMTTSLTDPEIETLVTLPAQSAGPLILLKDAPAVDVTTSVPAGTGDTTPPLIAAGQPDAGDGTGYVRWVAGAAVVVFFGVLFWLSRRPRDESTGD